MPLLAAIGEAAARAYGMYGRGGTTQAGFSGTISSNQTNLNLRTWALANGWNGTLPATITVGAGVYVYSTATGTPAMTINGSWPGGVTVVNSGFIMGMGGMGGTGPYSFSGGPTAGGNGGNAISLGINATIINNSYIGGGGGGGGGGVGNGTYETPGGGGGAGGGAGGIGPGSFGGAGGAPGASGATPAQTEYGSAGGGGGRIMPGVGGVGGAYLGGSTCAGGGGGGAGAGGGATSSSFGSFSGAAGGSAGAVGAFGFPVSSPSYPITGCGGGGWGAAGGGFTGALNYCIPGAGGKAIALNGFTATTSGSGTTYGAVS